MPHAWATTLQLPEDRSKAQQWIFQSGGRGDGEMALAYAILLAPAYDRWENQHVLILSRSTVKLCRRPPRANVEAIRNKLFTNGTIRGDTFTREQVFSSPSLAASVIEGGSRSGWDGWCLYTGFVSSSTLTLSDAHAQSKERKFEMKYYALPPHLVVDVAG